MSGGRGGGFGAIVAVHQTAMLGAGFLVAVLMLGGPLGFVPAEAALLAELRGWRDGGVVVPGAFRRLIGRAMRLWRPALPGGLLGLAAVALVGLGGRLAMPAPALAIAAALWLVIVAQHWAFLLSLGRAGWRGWQNVLGGAWRDLVAVMLWPMLGLATPLPLLPLALLFGPPLVALVLVVLEGAPSIAPTQRQADQGKI